MARKPKAADAAAETPVDETPMLALIETPNVPVPTVRDQAAVVLLDAQKFDDFYDRIKATTDAFVPDVSTAAGRRAIAAMAFRVTKTKTGLEAGAKALTEAWRAQTTAVNNARKPMVERLAALADEVRRPLTEWETAEANRLEANRATIARIREAATVTDQDTSATVEARGREIFAEQFAEPQWTPEEAMEAHGAQQATVQALVAAKKRLVQEEADAAELEELRRERAERAEREERERQEQAGRDEAARLEREAQEAREREEREARERAERERQEAEQREQAARDAAARAAQEAADQARKDAEARAEAERQEREAEHQRQLAAERAERERVERQAREAEEERQRQEQERERAAEAERKRLADEQAQRDREAAEAADAERKRQADKAHRRAVLGEAGNDILAAIGHKEGEDAPEWLRPVLLAIAAGNVRHVAVSF